MRPDLLAHLTDEERRAWEAHSAAAETPWKTCGADNGACRCHLVWSEAGDYVVAHTVTRDDENFTAGDGCDHVQAVRNGRAIVAAMNTLPAALTALAEARARVAELEADARMVAEAVMDGGWCSGEGTPDPDCKGPTARDVVATIREFYRFREEVWDAAELSDEEPALHGAGAPDASGVGSACTYSRAWIGPCGKPGEHGRCPDHASVVCSCCGAPATGECPQTVGLVCGSPLCDDCEHDPKPGWHCAHRRKPGASGVGALTNCDNCRFGHEWAGCQIFDGKLWTEWITHAVTNGAVQWARENAPSGHPKPGATGCPGWAKREGA